MRDHCPLCGAEPLYFGLTRLICSNSACANASEAESDEPPPEPQPGREAEPPERPLAGLVAEELRAACHEVSPVGGCMTWIADLDWLIGPLRPGELTLVEGPAGAGKTSLLLQVVGQAALWGQACAMISLESSEPVLLRRVLGNLGRVDPRRVGLLDRDAARRYV